MNECMAGLDSRKSKPKKKRVTVSRQLFKAVIIFPLMDPDRISLFTSHICFHRPRPVSLSFPGRSAPVGGCEGA